MAPTATPPVAKRRRAMAVEVLSPIAAATVSIPVFVPAASDEHALSAADHAAISLAPPAHGTSQFDMASVVDVADRRSALVTGAQVALQSSSIQVANAPVPPAGANLVVTPAIMSTVLPIATPLPQTSEVLHPRTAALPPVVAATDVTGPDVTRPAPVLAGERLNSNAPAAPSIAALDLPKVTTSVADGAASSSRIIGTTRAVTSVISPSAIVAADVIAELAGVAQAPPAVTNDVADRRLLHATDAGGTTAVKSADPVGTPDGTAALMSTVSSATGSASPTTALAGVSLLSATTPVPPSSNVSANAGVALTPSAVPVFPTPGAQPTGLIVGNGGVVGTTTQLLGPTSNSLFAGGNGYVTNGSLQVSNANFSQGYSVVTVLGIPLLTLNPVGTVLTSTTGAVVGGTGVNSHLTLLGGVTSNNYISNINNGGPNALLGVALPTSAPAYAATCLGALVVNIACYGVNAAQDYQVLVGDGATANGSKEVVIGTNASHTLPTVSADVAFPGTGRNDPTNPSGVPTADYEARLGHSVVVGDNATGSANAQTILGAEANATAANSVALGFQSAANRGGAVGYTAYGLAAPQTSVGEVSIGSAGAARQITNVAAGSVGTDAVNVLQLQAVVSAAAGDSVQYDDAGHGIVTLSGTPASTNGGISGGTTITNVHQGALAPLSTDAVNGSQLFATNSVINNVINTSSKYYQANSIGVGSVALGVDSLAAGPAAVATANGSIAEGSGATTLGLNSTALGTAASATGINSVALGAGSIALRGPQPVYTAYGLALPQASAGVVSVGTVGAERQISNVAAGQNGTDAVNVNQLAGVSASAANAVQYDTAVPNKASVTLGGPLSTNGGLTNGTTITNLHQGAINVTSTDAVNGSQLFATNNSISTIVNTTSKYYQANSTGAGSVALGTDALAAGPRAVATGNGSIAEGSGASTLGANSVALGTGASSVALSSVALGAGSAAVRGPQGNYAAFGLSPPQTSVGEVSVGAVGAERQVTNVAAGSAGTDAVNVNQLAGVSATAANAVQYDTGVPNKASVTLAGPASLDGGASNGTTITNLHQGALTPLSTDAVNGSQLFATNSTVSNIVNTTSKYFQANSTKPGSLAIGTDSLAAGPQAVSNGQTSIAVGSGASTSSQNAIAIGTGANANFANSVALGNGSVTTVGARANYTAIGLTALQTSLGELNVGTRQVTGVAAGSAGTDAVNVNQLAGVSTLATNSVQYDLNAPADTRVTLAGPVSTDGGVSNGTTITNLHQGALNATSTDAVNGSQLFATNGSINNIFNTTSKYYQANSTKPGSAAVGTDALAAGPNAVANGNSSIAEGSGAVTQGATSVALGAGANATGINSVALGAGSIATRGPQASYTAYGLAQPQASAGVVSVGTVGAERQISNVAAGQNGTDAVNVNQLADVSATAANAVQYDTGVPNKASVTLAGPVSTDGGVSNGTTITNLHQGALNATSTDAVNGSQLFATNNTITNVFTTGSKYYQANSTGAGSSAVGTDSLAAGPLAVSNGQASIAIGSNASTSSQNAIAIGTGANANFANSVALGNGSVTTVGARANYTAIGLTALQTSLGELNVGTRQVTGVAAGSAGTDAVNVNQLAGVSTLATNSVQYDLSAPADTRVTLAGPVSTDGGASNGTTITNLHQGALNATSTDAVNGAQLFATNSTVSTIFNTTSKYYQANSTKPGSAAVGTDALAAGPNAVANGNSSIAEGSGAVTQGATSVALGAGANATGINSVALGAGSIATRGPQASYTAYGLAQPQASAGVVSVGTVGAERQISNVAAGQNGTDAVNVNQLAGVSATAANAVQYDTGVPNKASVTLAGPVSTDGGASNGTTITNLHQGALNATSTDAVNGSQLFATNSTVSTIFNTTSKYYQANSTGAGSSAVGTDSLASGPRAVANGNGSIAEGNGTTTGGLNSVAIGSGASVTQGNSIAFGAGSLAQRGALANYAAYGLIPLQSSVGEVSVGAAGAARQITNVAAGQAATDAVNVAQLQGVSASAANAVQYDTSVPLRGSVTLAGPVSTDGGVTGGTLITNLRQGALTPTSTDAINGAQLYGWTLDPNNPYSNTSLYNSFINTPANKYLAVSSTQPGATANGVDSIALGPVATATADNALALGTGAAASMANSIALGAGSVTTVGARTNYVGYGLAAPQTSVGEVNVGNRQITGVAAASTPDGAVNLAQLRAVVATASIPAAPNKLAVLYTPDVAGNPTNAIALTGNGTGAPVSITNVAAGAETPTSTAAVNGSQVWHWSQDTTNLYSNTSLYNDITALGAGGNNKYVQVNSTLVGATASGTNSVAVGPATVASGSNSVAVGNGAQATAANAVALGSGSVATRDNTVSVGGVGTERQVTNVAAGTASTDAANVGQVNAGVQQAQNWATSYTDQKFGALDSEVQQIGNRANAGVAAAMAMAGLPQAYEPGKSMAAVAAGTFRSESSIAVGVSTISEGGRWVYKMTGSVDSRGDGGVSVGAGMQW